MLFLALQAKVLQVLQLCQHCFINIEASNHSYLVQLGPNHWKLCSFQLFIPKLFQLQSTFFGLLACLHTLNSLHCKYFLYAGLKFLIFQALGRKIFLQCCSSFWRPVLARICILIVLLKIFLFRFVSF